MNPKYRQSIWSEDGSIMSNVVFFGIVFAIIAIAFIDGASVFYAYQAAGDVTEVAAKRATQEWKLYSNLTLAEKAASDYCEENDLEVVEVKQARELSSNAFSVTCAKDADTYAFKHLPRLKDLTHQEVTSVSYSST